MMVFPRRSSLSGPDAPRRAREMVRHLLAGQPDDVVEIAVLLTSELVANAVTHTRDRSPVQVSASTSRGTLRVCVGDQDRVLPVLKHPSPDGDSGRGIEIVDHLATAWGVECRASEDGKSVWFELGLPAPARAEAVGPFSAAPQRGARRKGMRRSGSEERHRRTG